MAQDPNNAGDVLIKVTFGKTKFDVSKPTDCKFSELKKEILAKLAKFIKDFKHKDANSEDLLWLLNGKDELVANMDELKITQYGYARGANIPKNAKQLDMVVEEAFGITIKMPNSDDKHGIETFNSSRMHTLYFSIYNTISECESPYFDLYHNNKKLGLEKVSYRFCSEIGIKPFDELECKYTKVYDDNKDNNNNNNNAKYPIEVRTLTGKVMNFSIFGFLDIDAMKMIIRLADGTPKDQQRLIFAGKQLQDDHVCKALGIGENASVHLVLRLRGN